MTLTREGLEEALKLAGAAREFMDAEVEIPEEISGPLVEAVPAMAQALLRGLEAIEEWWCDDSTGHEVDEAVNAVLGRVRAALLGSDEAR